MEFINIIRHFPRHCKTAIQNIIRNGVMSVSSIFAVTITLLLIAVVGAIAVNVNEVTLSIENSLAIYVKVEREATSAQSKQVGEEIKKLPGVKEVTFSSKEEELEKLIEAQTEENKELFESYRKDNPLGDAYTVEVEEVNNLGSVAKLIEDIDNVNEVTYGGGTTNKLVRILEGVRNGGAVFVIGLTVVVLLMIANTIKITIASRSTEIAIMRMVGASNAYIRVPFELEGIFIGFIGSIVPITVLYYGYNFAYEQFSGMLSSTLMVIKAPYPFVWQLALVLIILGCGVGFIGSFFSVRRFLKF